MSLLKDYRVRVKFNFADMFTYLGKHIDNMGGWSELIASPYLIISLGITALCYNLWAFDTWWSLPISVLPNMLGFSLGGYTIMLSFGNERFQRALVKAKEENGRSIYDSLHADFVHFILVQALALLFGIVARSVYYPTPASVVSLLALIHVSASIIDQCAFASFSFFGFFLFIYSISLAISCILTVFMIGGMLKLAKIAEIDIEALKADEDPN